MNNVATTLPSLIPVAIGPRGKSKCLNLYSAKKFESSHSNSLHPKTKIYHSSSDLLSIEPKPEMNASDCENKQVSKAQLIKNKMSHRARILRSESTSKSIQNKPMKEKTCSENELSKINNNQPSQQKLVKHSKDKDSTMLNNKMNHKPIVDHNEELIAELYCEINDKNEQIILLQDEIKKRKYDMNEMSRRIIEMDQELKTCQCRKFNNFNCRDYDWNNGANPAAMSRSQSRLSVDDPDPDPDDNKNQNRWPKISRLKTLKRLLQKRNDDGSSKNMTSDCIEELQKILQEKEILITKLRLDTKITNHRLTEMENIVKKRDEESLLIKRNNEYFEKIFKCKLID